MIFFNASKYIIGVDEAGRGALAGEVFACACVVLKKDVDFFEKHVKDSKKIPRKKRDFVRLELEKRCVFEISSASVQEIVEKNILNATMLAMNRALDGLLTKLNIENFEIIIDGNKTPRKNSISIIKGDDKFFEIAAASIFAKTERDRKMIEYSQKFQEYGFEKHFGYGTKMHFDRVLKNGLCEIHRKSWFKSEKNSDLFSQQKC